jgi:hypothetical protein
MTGQTVKSRDRQRLLREKRRRLQRIETTVEGATIPASDRARLARDAEQLRAEIAELEEQEATHAPGPVVVPSSLVALQADIQRLGLPATVQRDGAGRWSVLAFGQRFHDRAELDAWLQKHPELGVQA